MTSQEGKQVEFDHHSLSNLSVQSQSHALFRGRFSGPAHSGLKVLNVAHDGNDVLLYNCLHIDTADVLH